MFITIEKLRELYACDAGIAAFLEAFPKGEVSFKVLMKTCQGALLSYDQRCHLGWLAKYPGLTIEERLQLLERTGDAQAWAGCAARDTEGIALQERLQLVELSYAQPAWRGSIAAYSDGLTFKERLQLIEQSDDPKDWARELRESSFRLTAKEQKQLRNMYAL
jgi:hypothetical protein